MTNRFSINFSGAVSSSANTASNALGLQTGTTRCAYLYELILGMNATAQDAQLMVQLFACSAFTAGSGITPAPMRTDGAAAVTGASSAPTVTTTGGSRGSIAFNSRQSIRWVPSNPEGFIIVQAGGTAAGALVVQNQQPGTAAGLALMHQLYFAE